MRTREAYVSGAALSAIGLMIQLLGIAELLRGFIYISPNPTPVTSDLLTLCGGLAAWAGFRIRWYGRRRLSRRTSSSRRFSDSAFVLYLRSFDDDDGRQRLGVRLIDVPFNIITCWVFASGLTEEEQFVAALRPVGPVLAVGNPGDRQPRAGAWRLDLPAKEWRPRVAADMERARLVVLMAGTGPGLVWEYAQAIRHVQPRRLMLAILAEASEYEQFRKLATEEVAGMGNVPPPVLPDYPSHEESPWNRATGETGLWFVRFDENWSTERIIPKPVYARKYMKWSFRNALLAVFPGLIAADMAAGRTRAARLLQRTLERHLWRSQLWADVARRLVIAVPAILIVTFIPHLSDFFKITFACFDVVTIFITAGWRASVFRRRSRSILRRLKKLADLPR
jgi:hypothetical protein